jgi:hypothetical protein
MLLTNVIMGQKVSCERALLMLPRAQMERRGRGQSARRSRAMKPKFQRQNHASTKQEEQ